MESKISKDIFNWVNEVNCIIYRSNVYKNLMRELNIFDGEFK